MAEEWGPWVFCDGAGGPSVSHDQIIQLRYLKDDAAGKITIPAADYVYSDFPGFFWRWKRVRVGWLKFERRRVCDDPDFAPVHAYRLLNPPAASVSLLTSIVEQPPKLRIEDETDRDPRLPKRVSA